MKTIDRYDRHVLQLLQEDADLTVSDIAERVGLSTNACWRRIKRLEEQNVIRQHVVLLSEKTLGLNLTVFVSIKTNEHNDNWLKRFAAGVKAIPEVVEFYRISGATDYLLKIITRDIQDYDRVYKKLISVAPLHDVSSSFAMERIKSSTALPLDHMST
ncbi:MAG: Lrp/AsnC family transcriptional regulator [Gammaproteobacteria bacterium]|jgi:Lrp/AsnC family transcriptional regulator|nr:Lrp/AsnC family transcriptional regulator [Gammaproteobacteria bacterium]